MELLSLAARAILCVVFALAGVVISLALALLIAPARLRASGAIRGLWPEAGIVQFDALWGAGAGSDKGSAEGAEPASGGGGGGGVRITPVAFIVVKRDEVSLLTLKEARISKIAEIIPTVIESIKGARGQHDAKEGEADEEA